nr:unnamed protein product [Spirometra erinaceieuropaei]
MTDRMIEVKRFKSPSVTEISSSSSSMNEHLMELASVKTHSRSRRRSCSRPQTTDTCWYHTEIGKPVSQRIDAAVFSGSSGSGRTFYVCDTATRKLFLVDTGAQISIATPTVAYRRFDSPGLYLQTADCSSIPTFGSLSLTPNMDIRRSFTRIFVISDVPHAILGSDFLVEFDLLDDCRCARLLDRTTSLFVRGLTPFTASTNLSVLNTDIASPLCQPLLSHPKIINPSFAVVRFNMLLGTISAPRDLPYWLDRDD